MIISICSHLFDYAGDFLLTAETDSDLSHISRRVSRSATLDGGCIIVDNGYTPSDATLTIVVSQITDSTRLALLQMIKTHSAITIAYQNNIFLGVVEKVDDTNQLKIKFLVKSALNEA